jgi:very-short-patch-repair endonuclease
MWQELRNRKCLGFKFIRQRIISSYIADFYCHELHLVIEIDGGVHDLESHKEYDAIRTSEFESYGLTVIRYSNNDILYHLSNTLEHLKINLKKISQPSK